MLRGIDKNQSSKSLNEAVQLSDKLRLFNSEFFQEFDGVNIFCQKIYPIGDSWTSSLSFEYNSSIIYVYV